MRVVADQDCPFQIFAAELPALCVMCVTQDGGEAMSSEAKCLKCEHVYAGVDSERCPLCGCRCEFPDPAQSVAEPAMRAAKPKTYADGYCAYCSNLSYSLTRALESTGVPTGADGWQQSYGPNQVKALADHETSLRRLLLALENGEKEKITTEVQRAEHLLKLHSAVYHRLIAKAQEKARKEEEESLRKWAETRKL